MAANSSGASELPKEIDVDATLKWAATIAADESLQSERSFAHFLELRERYRTLLKRLTKIARISDGFQLSLKELNLLLSTDARTDYLTGLSNRRDMFERLDVEISRANRHTYPVSVIIADIDGFKLVNDRYGHEAGDHVLIGVSDCFRRKLRLEDHCARWGGEEFLICLPQACLQGATAVAEKLRAAVEELAIEYAGAFIHCTVSLGVAEYHAGESIDDVVRAADRALIEAKQSGRNAVRAR